jgi:integrase
VALGDAKAKAGELRRQIAQGICPIHARRAEQASKVTFKEAAEGWVATHQPAWKGNSQKKNAALLLYHHGAPLAGKRVAEITPDMIQAALTELWNRAPEQGRRTLSLWARLFDFTLAKGWRQGANPCAWRGCHEYRFPRRRTTERGHHAAMDYAQLPQFMRDLRMRQDGGTRALVLEFTILTCVRTSEALGARWEEIDFDTKLWTIPASRMKANKKHEVPLSTRAIEILKHQQQHAPEQHAQGEYVFMGRNKTRLADRTMWNLLDFMEIKVSVHGFRSTFRDWCGDQTSFQREHVEACLAHEVGNDVERAYRRQTALEKRKEILTAWCDYCAEEL